MIQEYLDVFGDNVITHNRLESVGPMNLEIVSTYAVTKNLLVVHQVGRTMFVSVNVYDM